jgi:hypothetical protein
MKIELVDGDKAMGFKEVSPRNIVLHHRDGRKAIIEWFDGDRVEFSGDLPVSEAAKIFFDAVGHLLPKK